VQPKIETPNDSVSELHATSFETIVGMNIERKDFTIFDEGSDLPTDASLLVKRID